MDIILLEHIDELGTVGQTVKVKPGYARNYLFPKKLACPATAKKPQFLSGPDRGETEETGEGQRGRGTSGPETSRPLS